MTQSTSSRGFTLIELSIVLVIVGLIAAAILIGQEMIYAAKIRKVVSQLQETKTAFITFKLKYGQYPGDIATASDIWDDDDVQNGNGNGQIEGYDGLSPTPQYESYNAFHHLMLGGLVRGQYLPETGPGTINCRQCSLPVALENAYTGVLFSDIWTSSVRTNWLSISSLKTPAANGAYLGMLLATWNGVNPIGILGKDARAIDAKMDDGLPLTGILLSGSPVMGGVEQLSCPMLDGSNFYNINSRYYNCSLWTPIER